MKCDREQGGPQGHPPVETPRQWEAYRARLSLEANAVWTDRMLEALVKGVKVYFARQGPISLYALALEERTSPAASG